VPEPVPPPPRAACAVDETGLPLPEPAPPETLSCIPDLARGIQCSPDVVLRIPMHLGPQTMLYDVVFDDNERTASGQGAISDGMLSMLAGLPLGEPLSNQEVEEARLRLVDFYRDQGYFYAAVRSDLELSPD